MANRVNFYKGTDGEMHRYIYCNMCPMDKATPFTEDQEFNPQTKEGLFISSGKHIAFCLPCAKNVGLFRPPESSPHISYVGPPEKKEKGVRVTFSKDKKK